MAAHRQAEFGHKFETWTKKKQPNDRRDVKLFCFVFLSVQPILFSLKFCFDKMKGPISYTFQIFIWNLSDFTVTGLKPLIIITKHW